MTSPIPPTLLPRLDHVLLLAPDAPAVLAFFCDIVGLTEGPRPPFGFDGAWLYAGDQAVIHLVPVATTQIPGGAQHTGMLGHVAFRLHDLSGTRQRLAADGWAYQETTVPLTGETQLFVRLPGNLAIELVFDVIPSIRPT